ncbi:MAG TPA: PSD1 and planctomycete cytochrome C domain-containing protein [Planctomycetaceae bacterium]|jgi:mono/diheme cytochrome c family protein
MPIVKNALLPLIVCACLTNIVRAADEPAGVDPPVDYQTQIKPLLRERCFACHGALKQKAGLRLDTAALAIKGGDSGPAITPGNVAASPLLERVAAADESERMPPEGEPLKAEQIAALKQWIAQNAKAPADEKPERDPRDHWAFNPPVRPAIPIVDQPTPEQARWQLNPIDAFISAEQRKRKLVPQAPADKRVWLRRVSLDLIGLPPTPAEIAVFVADQTPEAYDKVVTRLLDSPQYGERWGRHWMDIWRYSDWWGLGAEVRNSQKHIWHWRDWIIESVNADKGYDQMLREMLAADELYPNDLDRLRATGYLARQYFIFNRTTWLDETIEHTAKGMLGLTVNCAKCHDHKYDPLAQVEYYKLRAIFEPYQIRTEMVPGQADFEKDGIPRAFDAHLDVPTHLHIRGDDRNPDKTRTLEPAVPAWLSSDDSKFAIEPVSLPVEATYPGSREFVVQAHRQSAERQIAAARTAIDAAKSKAAEPAKAATGSAAAAQPAPLPADQSQLALTIAEKSLKTAEALFASIDARAVADRARIAQAAELSVLALAASRSERLVAAARSEEDFSRAELAALKSSADPKANPDMKAAAAKAALKSANDAIKAIKAIDTPSETYTPLPGAKKTQEDYQNRNADKPFLTTSTGRRTAFAKWLTSPRHPLPARVAVNHIWMRHMGKPLVPTIFDFGRKGQPPTHPELLDWLAVELVEHNWSMKHMHRLIVTSQAYRLSSSSATAADATVAADPDNRWYWRMNPVRMEAEVVRDSLLSMAGELDVSLGGPPVAINDETSRRRSLYFVHSHNDHQKFLATFDNASVLDCYRRAESIVPQQALALENSPLATAMAGKIAQRIPASNPNISDAEFIRAAFVTVLSVEPTAEEQATASELLQRMTELATTNKRPDPQTVARTNLVHAILNHNDFITIR